MIKNPQVAVLGGGIAGLSAAFWLGEYMPTSQITLMDQGNKWGGKINTVNINGAICETGPQVLVLSKKETREFCDKIRVSDKLITSNHRAIHKLVLRHQQLYKVPDSIAEFLKTPLLSWRGKLAVLKDPFLGWKHSKGDKSVYEFGLRHFGREVTEILMDGVVNGVYVADIKEQSAACSFYHYYAMAQKHGSVGRGLLLNWKKRPDWLITDVNKNTGYGGFANGMDTLVESVQKILSERKVRSKLNTEVHSIEKKEDGLYSIGTSSGNGTYDAVISALPGSKVTALIGNNFSLPSFEWSLDYSPLIVANVGLSKRSLEKNFNGLGYWVPSSEKSSILSCVFSSEIFDRGERDLVVWSFQLGGIKNPEILNSSDKEIGKLILMELEKLFHKKLKFEFAHFYRHREALPQFSVGHLEKTMTFKKELRSRFPELALCGNAFYGSGLNSGIAGGKAAAAEILKIFKGSI